MDIKLDNTQMICLAIGVIATLSSCMTIFGSSGVDRNTDEEEIPGSRSGEFHHQGRVNFNRHPIRYCIVQGSGLFVGISLILWALKYLPNMHSPGFIQYIGIGIPTSIALVFALSKMSHSESRILDMDAREVELWKEKQRQERQNK